MTQLKIITISVILAFVSLLAGCLEHRYRITAQADKSVGVEYELRGDRVDLEDGNELLPDSMIWSVVRSIEETEDQTTHILKGFRFIKTFEELGSSLDWQKGAEDSIYFRPQISLTARSIVFGKIWFFSTVIPSRRFIESFGDIWDYVPEECRVIENENDLKNVPADEVKMLERKFGLGVIQWNRARYERSFDRVWQICAAQNLLIPDENQIGLSVAKAGWVDDLHLYLNSLDVGEPQTANLNWWTDIKGNFIDRFSNLVPQDNIEIVGRIADAIERNYLISKDLEDDKFLFDLTLPGFISAGNGIRTEQTVSWNVSGKDIANEDVILTASTFQLDFAQITGTLFLIALIVWGLTRRKKRTTIGTIVE